MRTQESSSQFKKKDALFLGIILCIAVVARIYHLQVPLADFHSWRQADTSAVARNFARDGFDLLHPRYDDFSNVQTGVENPHGYRMVEFPLYNAFFALLYKIYPPVGLEVYGRVTTAFFSLIVIAIVYYFGLKESGRLTAVASSITFAVFPFFVFFSRVVLPEMMSLALAFIALLFLYWYMKTTRLKKKVFFYIVSVLAFALGVLIKPFVVFYFITCLYLFSSRYGFLLLKKFSFYLYFVLISIPFLWWRYHISFYPEGIAVNQWLFHQVNTPEGRLIIFLTPAFFRWIFYERISSMIFGGYLTALFVLGFILKPKRYFIHSLLVCALLFIFVFEGGNVQHEYYQVLIFPPLALMVGLGTQFIVSKKDQFISPIILYPTVVAVFLLSLFFSFYRVRYFYEYPNELKRIADVIKDVTKPEDKIVADRLGDTTLLYLADRRGSSAPYKELSEFKKDGYKYFVTFHTDVIENMKKEEKYRVAAEAKIKDTEFAIFEL